MSADAADSLHVAVDLGASGGRVALGSLSEGRLTTRVLHRWDHGAVPCDGGLHWDIERIWAEIMRGLSLAPPETESVGVASWGVDYALVDETDELVAPVHHYRSPRTDGLLREFLTVHGEDAVYARTGIQYLPFNTLGQLLAHARDDPSALRRAAALLLIPDFFHSRLCGVRANERTNASTTQLLDARTGTWCDDLIAAVGVPRRLFGSVHPSGTGLAPLRPEIAAATGLRRARIVLPATHDTASAVAAVPAEGDRWAYVSSGTWSLAGVEVPRPVLTSAARLANATNEAGHAGTTRLLKNVMGLWILQECRRAWGDPLHEGLLRAAAEAKETVAFDVDDPVFLPPGLDMPARVTRATGLSDRAEIVRAILASLAAKTAEAIRGVAALARMDVGAVHIVGGGSRVELLKRLIADDLGRPIIVGPADATLIGNLLVQAEGLGRIPRGSIRATVRAMDR